MKLTRLIALATVALAASCTKPPPDPPGVEDQPTYHYERNPAQYPTTSAPAPQNADDPSTIPTQLPGSEGTVNSPRSIDEQTPTAR